MNDETVHQLCKQAVAQVMDCVFYWLLQHEAQFFTSK